MADRERDRKFRHELFPQGVLLASLAAAVIVDLLTHEEQEGVRQRRRKPAAHLGMVNAVRIIITNLAYFTLFPPEDGTCTAVILPLAHPGGKPIEPAPAGFGADLTATLQGLQATGVLVLTRPADAGLATTIVPTLAFRGRLMASGVTAGDIGRGSVFDCLRLSQKDGRGRRTRFPIPDTLEAQLYRDQLVAINAHLSGVEIAYMGNNPVDVADRTLVRHFNMLPGTIVPSLDYGGRLFGGFWLNMPKPQRQHIRINGEPLVELDYGQVFPRLAFGLVRSRPPEGIDLYYIPELEAEAGAPHRAGVKAGFNALLWGTVRWGEEIAETLPSTWPASRLRKALVAQYPALTNLLQRGSTAGYRLMNRESTIMVAVLLSCMAAGITVLPIHDAVLVPISVVDIVQQIMEREALCIAGVPIPAALKP